MLGHFVHFFLHPRAKGNDFHAGISPATLATTFRCTDGSNGGYRLSFITKPLASWLKWLNCCLQVGEVNSTKALGPEWGPRSGYVEDSRHQGMGRGKVR